MAYNNYQSLIDLLNPKKEEQLFSPINPTSDQLSTPINPTPEQLASIVEQQQIPQTQIQAPVQPVIKQVSPKKEEALSENKNIPPIETPISKSEALIAEYNRLLGKNEADLAEARKSDRILKIGGSIGDALATYLNAQSQMNVKAPGVQVQQGAGLGKIADMFATSPEIASDIAQKREAMMKQYGELAKGERAQARLTSEEQIAKGRMAQQERLTQAEIDAKLEAARIGTAAGNEYKDQESKKRDERFIKGKMDSLMDKVSKDFRYKDAYKESLSFDQVDKLIQEAEKGNEVAFNTVGTKMAKAMGEVGVLTESDVSRYVEGGSLTRKAGDSLLRMMNGKPSKATIDDIKQITKVLRDSHESKLQPIFDDYVRRAVQLGKTREEAYKTFGFPLPDDLKQQTQETKKEEQVQPQLKKLSPEQQKALDWANKNPNNPMSEIIKKKKLGL